MRAALPLLLLSLAAAPAAAFTFPALATPGLRRQAAAGAGARCVSAPALRHGILGALPQSAATQLSVRGALHSRSGRGALLRMDAGGGARVPLVVGLNKYSHDAAVCIARRDTGETLLIWSKERLTRKKHDAGDTADLLQTALESIDRSLEDVELVVSNNHHFRVLPYEANRDQLAWSAALGHVDASYASEHNLVPGATHRELSHHLAHAWSAAAQAPFASGLVVVMDGMGESLSAMRAAKAAGDGEYYSDLNLEGGAQFPASLDELVSAARHGFRESETAYTFSTSPDGAITLKPVAKRWVEERSPPTLYNSGFENMESLGGVYSRASSVIFGDWNACGKVMGLAPWDSLWSSEAAKTSEGGTYMEGAPLDEAGLKVNWEGLQVPPLNSKAKYGDVDAGAAGTGPPASAEAVVAARIAAAVQRDLEQVAMATVKRLKAETGEANLCIAGGVGLNSVLNGRLARELGFTETFVPAYPGDDGIAVGCCAWGLHGASEGSKAAWKGPLSPYQGPAYSDETVDEAVEAAAGWLNARRVEDEGELVQETAELLASGKVVAWYQGRSEAGPRALGHRSILADPRNASMVSHINVRVKSREPFRPFAPSCLAPHAHEWFEGMAGEGVTGAVSPYMSLTADVIPAKRRDIPAVTHVDGTSRLQTVEESAEPLYFRLISAFFKLTGIPMVLNTSFNTLPKEPITESPSDGIRSFLYAKGAIHTLVMGKWVLTRKDCPIPTDATITIEEAELLVPRRAGPFIFETTETVTDDSSAANVPRTRVAMPAAPTAPPGEGWVVLTDPLEAEILVAADGETSVADMLQEFVTKGMEDDDVTAEEVLERLAHLYDLALLSF